MFKTITTLSTLLLYLLFHAVLTVAAEQKILEEITFDTISGDEEQITFTLNGLYIPKIFAMKGEKPRVVFDFQDTKPSRLLKNTINTNGKFIKRIRVGIHNEPTPKTRVVFDLMPDQDVDFKHSFDKENNALIISVFQVGSEPELLPVPQQAVEKKETEATMPSQVEAPEKTTPPPALEAAEPAADTQPPAVIKKQDAAEAEAPPVTEPEIPAALESETPAEKKPESPAAPQPVTPQVQPKTFAKAEVPAAEQVAQDEPAAKTQTSEPARKADVPILNSVTFDNSSNRGEMVLFRLNKFNPPVVFGVDEGQPRVVCDFKETAAAEDLPAVIPTNGQFVRAIRIGKETNPEKVRVVLDLAAAKKYDLQQVFFKEDNLFVLIINTLGSTPSTDDLKQLPREQQD